MEASDSRRQPLPKAESIFEFVNASRNNNNNNDPTKKLKDIGAIFDSGESVVENKEANNNHLTMNSVDIINYGDSSFWSCTDSGVMLEDLNNWTENPLLKGGDNTDGTIYTLTVLDGGGGEQAGFYKQEDKEEGIPAASTFDIDALLGSLSPSHVPPSYRDETDPIEEHRVKEFVSVPAHQEVIANAEWEENNNEVESLLRSALQGKVVNRPHTTTIVKKEDDKLIVLDGMYESPSLQDSDNPSSAQSIDDIFLSQLDVSYPADYERLRKIETEVEQYCGYLPTNQMDPLLVQSNKSSKKYTKRNKASSSGVVKKERSLHYCSVCNKGFKDKYSVNVHIRTHTGEKPFTCSLCGKRFRQKAHLAKHYQTHLSANNKTTSSNSKSSSSSSSSSSTAILPTT